MPSQQPRTSSHRSHDSAAFQSPALHVTRKPFAQSGVLKSGCPEILVHALTAAMTMLPSMKQNKWQHKHAVT